MSGLSKWISKQGRKIVEGGKKMAVKTGIVKVGVSRLICAAAEEQQVLGEGRSDARGVSHGRESAGVELSHLGVEACA